MIYAIVGSGGKTTLVHKMAEEFRSQGKRVFVTTSTHMRVESDTILSDDPQVLIGELEEKGYVMAGLPVLPKVLPEGMTLEEVIRNPVKMGEISYETYKKVSAVADVTLIEADGSRGLPVKYPNETEPVIYENVDQIIVVCGLHGLGRRIGEACFRPELVMACLNTHGISHGRIIEQAKREAYLEEGQTGWRINLETPLEPWHIQKLVREGFIDHMKKQYPEKEVSIYPTTDGSLYQRALAGLMAADMDVNLIKKEWFDQRPCLFIVGGGHVGKALAEFGMKLNFRVKVMDDRPEVGNRERFPDVDEVICDSFEHVAEYAEEGGFNVVATYGHSADFSCARALMQTSYRYLGMIASRRKVAEFHKLLAEDVKNGIVTEEIAQSLHSPIGLPIGANTPAEIAVSILAEIIQEKSKTNCSSIPQELLDTKISGKLCVIIDKSGSSPRGKGTMMLVAEDQVLGTVGGGTLEAAVMKEAKAQEGAFIKEYKLNGKDQDGLAMICGGNNTILFIPV